MHIKNFRIIADGGQCSRGCEVVQFQLGSALEALAFLTIKYSFSQISLKIFLQLFFKKFALHFKYISAYLYFYLKRFGI